MSIFFYIKLYVCMVPVFLLFDAVWLGVLAKDMYWTRLGPVVPLQVNWVAALVFYLIYIVGILVFAVRPGLEKEALSTTLLWAALFGFFTYATYDLTNMATIKGWPLFVVVVDIIWGMAICSVVAAAGYGAGRWLSS